MTNYTWSFKNKFSQEFSNFPYDQQNKILDFVGVYESHGLSDFSKYEGKIAPSWSGLDENDLAHAYAQANSLWHYHIGIPTYTVRHGKYKTSDMVLHFQWPGCGPHIDIVDVYYHYKSDGTFYVPPLGYLT